MMPLALAHARGMRGTFPRIHAMAAAAITSIRPASSLSAIHRGLAKSNTRHHWEGRGSTRNRIREQQSSDDVGLRNPSAATNRGGPMDRDTRKWDKQQQQPVRREGAATRAGRFHDPGHGFGKGTVSHAARYDQGLLSDAVRELISEGGGRPEARVANRARSGDDGWEEGGMEVSRDKRGGGGDEREGKEYGWARADKAGRNWTRTSRGDGAKPRTSRGERSDERPNAWSENISRDRYRDKKRPDQFRDDESYGRRSSRDSRTVENDRGFGDREARYDGTSESGRDGAKFEGFRGERRQQQQQHPDRFADRFGDRPSRDRRYGDRSADPSGRRRPRDSDRNGDDNDSSPPDSQPSRKFPISVPYTTAASQFLYGRSAVLAALRLRKRKLYKLYVLRRNGHNGSDQAMVTSAKECGVAVEYVDDARVMDKMSQGRPHNGFVLEASDLPRPPVVALGEVVGGERLPQEHGFHLVLGHQSREEAGVNGTETFVPCATRRRHGELLRKPFVLLLDGILDPGNLGNMLRTALFLGVSAVGITTRGSSPISATALKAASGATEEISVFSVPVPCQDFIQASRAAGWRVYAAVAPPAKGYLAATAGSGRHATSEDLEEEGPLLGHPCVLVVGNEGFGLDADVRKAASHEVYIPRGHVVTSSVDSLNVTAAAAVLCNSMLKIRAPAMERARQEWEKGQAAGQEAGQADQDTEARGGGQEEEEVEGALF